MKIPVAAFFVCLFICIGATAYTKEYSGSVIDSVTQQRISGAIILSSRSVFLAKTDNKGQFNFKAELENDSIFVYIFGYSTKRCQISDGGDNAISMACLNNVLEEFVFNNDKITANEIIEKVNQEFGKNVSSEIYSQRLFSNMKTRYFDSIILDVDNIEDIYNIRGCPASGFDLKKH